MRRILQSIVIALAAFGLASGAALAQQAPKADAKKTEAAKPAEAPKADAKKETPKVEAKAELMDINSATEKELASLKGIGDVRAKAIVKGRPYKGKDELVQKKIIPEGVYNDIKDQIIAKQDMAKADAKKTEMKKEEPKKEEKKK